MSERDDRKKPETAVEEVLREVEDAERRTGDSAGHHHRGEAGEAITPNAGAQEESRGDQVPAGRSGATGRRCP